MGYTQIMLYLVTARYILPNGKLISMDNNLLYMKNNKVIDIGNNMAYVFGNFNYNFVGARLTSKSATIPKQTFPIDLTNFIYFSLYSKTNITNAYDSYGGGTNHITVHYFLNSNNKDCFTFSNFAINMGDGINPHITEQQFVYNFSFRRGELYSACATSNTTGGSTLYPDFNLRSVSSVDYTTYSNKNSNSITIDGNITIYYCGIQMVA